MSKKSSSCERNAVTHSVPTIVGGDAKTNVVNSSAISASGTPFVIVPSTNAGKQLNGDVVRTNLPHGSEQNHLLTDTLPRKLNTLGSKSKSSSTRSEAKRLIELEMNKLQEEFKMEKRFLERKYELLKEYASETASSIENDDDEEAEKDSLSKVEEWLTGTDRHGEVIDSGLVTAGTNEQTPNRSDKLEGNYFPNVQRTSNPGSSQVNQQGQHSQDPQNYRPSRGGVHYTSTLQTQSANEYARRSRIQFEDHPRISTCPQSYCNPRPEPSSLPVHTGTLNDFAPGQRSTPVRLQQLEEDPAVINYETAGILNRSQIAARQAVSGDLPEFDGTLEDWPLFYATFNSSTKMCGFTQEENMLRLRKCLQGKALEAVRCELLYPSNVSDIMSTLKMLYGRPDAIIQSIVRKIRNLPPPSTENLETVVNFALTVKNMVATIRACDMNDFVFNASLRYELVERLPSSLKLDWARFSRNYSNPSLADFSSWLYTVAEDASTVMFVSSHEQQNRTSRRDESINCHSESDSSSETDYGASNTAGSKRCEKHIGEQCVVCKGGCTTVAKCNRLDSRWATVKECKLCRQCLRKHNGSCRHQKRCGINGCSYTHHPLLHKTERPNIIPASLNSQLTSLECMQSDPSCNIHQGQSKVLFRIVPVVLHGPQRTVRTYAFIDDGSEVTLMEQSLADELGVDGPTKPLRLKWTGGTQKVDNQSKLVNVQISGIKGSTKYDLSEINTIPSLQIRPQTLLPSELQMRFPYLSGLPLEEYQNAYPRVLIGLDYADLGYGINSREGMRNEPIAVETRLGWMVYGNCMGQKGPVPTSPRSVVEPVGVESIIPKEPGAILNSCRKESLAESDEGVETNTLWDHPSRIPGGLLSAPRNFMLRSPIPIPTTPLRDKPAAGDMITANKSANKGTCKEKITSTNKKQSVY